MDIFHRPNAAKMIRLIAAIDENHGLADANGIPWQGKIPTDSHYFSDQTVHGVILMGFRTYEEFDHSLHDRLNFVVTRAGTPPLRPGFRAVLDLGKFFDEHAHEMVWVIGGASLFAQTMSLADELYITQLNADFHCTKFLPEYDDDFLLEPGLEPHLENGISYRFEIWRRNAARLGNPDRHAATT